MTSATTQIAKNRPPIPPPMVVKFRVGVLVAVDALNKLVVGDVVAGVRV